METTLANWNRCKPEILKNGAEEITFKGYKAHL